MLSDRHRAENVQHMSLSEKSLWVKALTLNPSSVLINILLRTWPYGQGLKEGGDCYAVTWTIGAIKYWGGPLAAVRGDS